MSHNYRCVTRLYRRRFSSQAWAQATIAQSDLVGFTSLASSREPMEVVRIISELFDHFDASWSSHAA